MGKEFPKKQKDAFGGSLRKPSFINPSFFILFIYLFISGVIEKESLIGRRWMIIHFKTN
jgi:hypothetical protein